MHPAKTTERKKRYLFMGVSGAAVATGLGLTWWLGAPLLGYGLVLGFDWLKYRGKNGMYF